MCCQIGDTEWACGYRDGAGAMGFAAGDVVGCVADDDDIGARDAMRSVCVHAVDGIARQFDPLGVVTAVRADRHVDVWAEVGQFKLHGGDGLHIAGQDRLAYVGALLVVGQGGGNTGQDTATAGHFGAALLEELSAEAPLRR